jgi:hypothetical protein
MLLRKLDAWINQIEKRLEKWGKRQAVYWAGRKAFTRDKVGVDQNPYAIGCEDWALWRDGWIDAYNRAHK